LYRGQVVTVPRSTHTPGYGISYLLCQLFTWSFIICRVYWLTTTSALLLFI